MHISNYKKHKFDQNYFLSNSCFTSMSSHVNLISYFETVMNAF